MAISARDYALRAAEMARLANLTKDEGTRSDLLRLRQSYLTLAARHGMTLDEALRVAAEQGKGTKS